MMKLFLFALMVSTIHTYPLKEDEDIKALESLKNKEIDDLKKVLDDVSYVTKFKNMMADYVKSQYNELTVHDMEKIQEYLEDFCHKFAKDLKDIIENAEHFKQIDKIDDGLPDSTFEEVKNCIKNELPNIKDETADQVTFALRKNIYVTRQKIDQVIRESEKAAIDNS
ncbi:unnamed protein product, partial [Brenthis ino]